MITVVTGLYGGLTDEQFGVRDRPYTLIVMSFPEFRKLQNNAPVGVEGAGYSARFVPPVPSHAYSGPYV
jgi:hypothetical protein